MIAAVDEVSLVSVILVVILVERGMDALVGVGDGLDHGVVVVLIGSSALTHWSIPVEP